MAFDKGTIVAEEPLADQVVSLSHQATRRMIPHRKPMVHLDEVEFYSPRQRKAVAIKNVALDEFSCQGHFPDDPIFPGSLLAEALAQTCGLVMNLEYLVNRRKIPLADLAAQEGGIDVMPPLSALVETKVKQLGLVRPGDRIQLEAHVLMQRGEMFYFKVRALVKGTEVAKGEMMMAFPDYMAS